MLYTFNSDCVWNKFGIEILLRLPIITKTIPQGRNVVCYSGQFGSFIMYQYSISRLAQELKLM